MKRWILILLLVPILSLASETATGVLTASGRNQNEAWTAVEKRAASIRHRFKGFRIVTISTTQGDGGQIIGILHYEYQK